MQNNKGNSIKLGLFVSVGLVLTIAGIYFIGKKQQLFNQTFQISGVFKDISGLQVGNNVRFAGINIGVISNIELIADTAVRVDFVIDENARKFIKKDAMANIGTDGLMGNKIVIISPGSIGQTEIEANDFISTAVPISMDDILYKLKVTVDNSASITSDLSTIFGKIRTGKGTIGKLFMDTVFADNIDKTVVNIKQGAKGFKTNMDAAKDNILLRGYFKKKEKEKENDKESDKVKVEEQQKK